MEVKKLLEKKKLLIAGAIILGSIGVSAGVFAATQLTGQQVKVTEQQAKDIVTKEAPNGQITKFKLDKEHGKMVYEVEVMEGNVEKEFDIDAETGAILKSETETKDKILETPKISYEQSKEIALKQSKDGKFKEIELKHKKGILVYDVELSEGLMDREFIIDANTGEILRHKKDF